MSVEADVDTLAELIGDDVLDGLGDVGSTRGDEDASSRPRKHRRGRREEGLRKKRVRKSKFVDDAAGEGSSEEEDDDDEELAAEREAAAREDTSYIDSYVPDRRLLRDEGTEEQIASRIEARYKSAKAAERVRGSRRGGDELSLDGGAAGGSDARDGRYAASRLPRPTDPKVFAVKCKPGMARKLVARIINKWHHYRVGNNYAKQKVDLGIISAFSVDHVKEYIYIESHRQGFVENALNGLEGVFRFKISPVDPQDLMQLLERQENRGDKLKIGSFVRLRQAPYKMDLGQVVDLLDGDKRAVVRVVPREDYVRKPFIKTSRRNAVPLEQKFFSPELAIGAHELSGHRWRWGELVFDGEGYLMKTSSTRLLFTGSKMIAPTVKELKTFFKGDRAKIIEATSQAAGGIGDSAPMSDYRVGDVVRVERGQLKGVIGTILEMNLVVNTATIAPSAAAAMKAITTRLDDIGRYFAPGAPVVVVKGRLNGAQGIVLRHESNGMVVFVTQGAQGEMEVPAMECRQSKLQAPAGHTLSSWRIYDLVMLRGGTSVGCIVEIASGNRLTVITTRNGTQEVGPADLKLIEYDRPFTLDRFNNKISLRDEIAVTGPTAPPELQGITGRVERMFHNTLFAVSHARHTNAGMFAIPAECTVLVGGRNKLRAPHFKTNELPTLTRKAHPATRAEATPARHELPPADEMWDNSSSYWK